MAKTGKYASFRRQHDDEHSVVDYKLVTLTNEADRGVLAFRDWLAKIAGGYIPYKGNPHMPESSHEVVFDVWNGHTKHCIHCQRGLRHCRRVRKFAFLLAMCVGVLRPANKFVSLFASCAFVGVGLALDRVIRLFHRCEFSHGYND